MIGHDLFRRCDLHRNHFQHQQCSPQAANALQSNFYGDIGCDANTSLARNMYEQTMSSIEGAEMRILKQRERNGSIIFEAELHRRMIRHCAEYLKVDEYILYFSKVRRRAA
jgi:hypothetical protein